MNAIILSVGLIAVVESVRSRFTSAGSTEFIHASGTVLVEIVGPIGVPDELASLMLTYASTSAFILSSRKCRWNLWVPPGMIENPSSSVIKDSTK